MSICSFIFSFFRHALTLAHYALNSARIEADRMSHIEHMERASRQGQRRKHQRWSGPDHFHNDSRLDRLKRVKEMLQNRSQKYKCEKQNQSKRHSFLSALLFL